VEVVAGTIEKAVSEQLLKHLPSALEEQKAGK
jgi:hypothetical protein